MPSFLEDISPFYGTGEKNAAGQTLEEFLEAYDPYRYKNPCCTTDAVVFSAGKELNADLTGLRVLLVRRSNHPSIGCWALPGGFVNLRENLEDTARRELEEETGVNGIAVEQFACYGDYDRDPRARVITTACCTETRIPDTVFVLHNTISKGSVHDSHGTGQLCTMPYTHRVNQNREQFI